MALFGVLRKWHICVPCVDAVVLESGVLCFAPTSCRALSERGFALRVSWFAFHLLCSIACVPCSMPTFCVTCPFANVLFSVFCVSSPCSDVPCSVFRAHVPAFRVLCCVRRWFVGGYRLGECRVREYRLGDTWMTLRSDMLCARNQMRKSWLWLRIELGSYHMVTKTVFICIKCNEEGYMFVLSIVVVMTLNKYVQDFTSKYKIIGWK